MGTYEGMIVGIADGREVGTLLGCVGLLDG